MGLLFQISEQIPTKRSFPKECIVLKPREQKLIKVKAPFIDEISGFPMAKVFDDTFVITKAEHSQTLLQHINNKDLHIQFTVEPTQGTLPFLDTLVTIQPDKMFSATVYRKPTHTDQYLHWDSNHHITAKQSVYNTLAHTAKVVS